MVEISQTTFSNTFSWMKIWVSITISMKCVHRGRINNIVALLQIMAWCSQGSTLRVVRSSNPTWFVLRTSWVDNLVVQFKYQYTRKFLYQPRKWLFGQPARKLSVDPWLTRWQASLLMHICITRPQWVNVLTHWPLREVEVILQVYFSNWFYKLITWVYVLPVKLVSIEYHRTPLMISRHWFRQLFGAWANVDWDLCCHMASLGHNELTALCDHT